jgi:hypothetical protein
MQHQSVFDTVGNPSHAAPQFGEEDEASEVKHVDAFYTIVAVLDIPRKHLLGRYVTMQLVPLYNGKIALLLR